MSRILVSLLSKYLQPNFLFIKEMQGEYDQLVFVSTNEMEAAPAESTSYLLQALGLPADSINPILVRADDYSNIMSKLERQNFSPDDQYIVNPTGGTKVMAVALCAFFRNFSNVRYCYVPEGKNIISNLYTNEQSRPLNYRLTLKEYFTLNRLSFECEPLMHNKVMADGVFEKLKHARFNKYRVQELRDPHSNFSNANKTYYSGQWFEEYVYFRLKEELHLSDSNICRGAKIFMKGKDTHNNEIDVMFVKGNELYIIECKTSLTKNPKVEVKDNWDGYMYKLAAIAKDFGLRVHGYIFTLHQACTVGEGTIEAAKTRMGILGIRKTLFAEDFLKNKINLI